MEFLSKVLVVDESKLFRKFMQVLLAPYSESVVAVADGRDACARLAEHSDISLVLSDVGRRDGDGFAILSFVRERAEPRPGVVLLTAHPRDEEAQRAIQLGALGYLSKPTTLHAIRRACSGRTEIPRQPPLRAKRPSVGTALLIEPAAHHAPLAFEIHDLSVSGAFLETEGPVPVGTELLLALVLDGETLEVKARVVRVQEPSWANAAGVGVRFEELPDAMRRTLDAHIERAARVH
jgi:CheY-like chemotaxis protein